MNSRIRIGLVGLSVLALAGTSAAPALAASGRGTANSSITLLNVKLGDLQSLKVLVDEGQGTLDPAHLGLSGPQALASLTVADASGAINLRIPEPPIKASAPGTGSGSLSTMSVKFPPSQVAGVGNLPLGLGTLVEGTVTPIKVEANQDAAGARTAVGTEIPSLNVLQGLVSIKDVKIGDVTSNASPSSSNANTGVLKIGEINVLDLSEFLGALGLGLDDLGVGALTGLVDKLGLPLNLASVPGASSLGGISDVTSILSTVTGLASTLTSVTNAVSCGDLTNLAGVGSLLGGLNLDGILGGTGLLSGLGLGNILNLGNSLASCSNFASTQSGAMSLLNSTLDGLVPTAENLLGQIMGALDGAPLLRLSGVELSALANAADTLAGSSATTAVNLGKIMVGGLDLGVLDLNATAAQVTSLVNTVTSTLNTVTSVLGLPNLIDIGILERVANTKTEGNYNIADASVNALRVSINPPSLLSNALAGVTALPVGDLLSGGIIPSLPFSTGLLQTGDLAKAMSLTSLLSQPTTITVGSIRALSDYTVDPSVISTPGGSPAAPPVSGELPRTGANGALLGALAAVALGGAFGLSRVLRRRPQIEG